MKHLQHVNDSEQIKWKQTWGGSGNLSPGVNNSSRISFGFNTYPQPPFSLNLPSLNTKC
jgi:hypothetical protein